MLLQTWLTVAFQTLDKPLQKKAGGYLGVQIYAFSIVMNKSKYLLCHYPVWIGSVRSRGLG